MYLDLVFARWQNAHQGQSLQTMAKQYGVALTTIGRIRQGKTRTPKKPTLEKIAALLADGDERQTHEIMAAMQRMVAGTSPSEVMSGK
ncbi:MAG: helix-turn-helix transcriptional regulator [Candidatus Berkelbacteria bacterium]|nr:helix-turn-helix transcriptional regulator [Candidatus Berkelbacteria bacterium]